MKLLGILVILLGWLIAVLSVDVSSLAGEYIVVLIGLGVILVGLLGILNPAHVKHAIWKQ